MTDQPSGFRSCSLLPAFDPVPGLLSRKTFSILCGAPFSGKTALILPAVQSYLQRGEFLGAAAPRHPGPGPDAGATQLARLGYLSCDRSHSAVARMLHGAQLPSLSLSTFPVVSWQAWRHSALADLPARAEPAPMSILDTLYQEFAPPRPQLLLIEGLQTLMPDGRMNDNAAVARWCSELNHWMDLNDVTILGTTATAKVKGDEKYQQTHDSILGAIAWAQHCHSLLHISRLDPEGSQTRKLITMTHEHGEQAVGTQITYYDFDSHRHLVPTVIPDNWRDQMWMRLQKIPEGEPITRAEFQLWGKEIGQCSVRLIDDWLAENTLPIGGLLERVKKGVYRRPYKS